MGGSAFSESVRSGIDGSQRVCSSHMSDDELRKSATEKAPDSLDPAGAEEAFLGSLSVEQVKRLSDKERRDILTRFVNSYGNCILRNQPDRAFEIILKAHGLFPDERVILVNLSGSYSARRKYEKSLEYALAAIEETQAQLSGEDENSLIALAHNNAANACLRMGQTDAARGHLEKSLALKPDLAGSNYLMGEILSEKEEFAQSVHFFSRAFDEAEGSANPEDYSLYARALGKTDRRNDAVDMMKRGTDRFPLYPGMHLNLASMYSAEKRFAEALYELHIELLLFTGTERYYRDEVNQFLKGVIDSVMNDRTQPDYEEVTVFLKVSRKLAPELIEEMIRKSRTKPFLLQVYLAEAYAAQGDLEKARRAYEMVMLEAPYFVPVYIELGEVYQRLKDNDKAENLFRQAVRIMPDNWKVKALLKTRPDLLPRSGN